MTKLHDQMFVAQTTLEAWLDSGKVEFDGRVVRLKSQGVAFDLESAVRFVSIIDGVEDSNLLGKVLPESRIKDLGGEVLGDSVVFGEIAFQVRPGYIATRQGTPAISSEFADKRKETTAETLARFHLDKW